MNSIAKPIEQNIVTPILGDEFEAGQAKAQGKCSKEHCNTKAIYKPSKIFRSVVRLGSLGAGIGGVTAELSGHSEDVIRNSLIGGGLGVANALIFPGIAFHTGRAYEGLRKKIANIVKSK